MNNIKRAGIFIPTMNRSDFINRQLNYYAMVKCPHTIYIGDSSNEDHKAKIKNVISTLGSRIKIVYKHLPSFSDREAIFHLLSVMDEPYACLSGDDDYQVPDSITKCINFLESNPDFATASGYAVSFRLKKNGVYGELERVANYPRPYVESETARERIVKYFENYFVPLFSVNRTAQMLKNWKGVDKVKDKSFGSEIIPSALSIIAGKSMTIDCLGFIRQIHDGHYGLPNTFDWITGNDWLDAYNHFSRHLSEEAASVDNIQISEAEKFVKQGLWLFLEKQLTREYPQYFPPKKNPDNLSNYRKRIRAELGRQFPFLKTAYRKWLQKNKKGPKDIHFEVLQKSSKYYEDFKPIIDSFSNHPEI